MFLKDIHNLSYNKHYYVIIISDRLSRIKRSPNFVSKFKDTFEALQDLQDLQLDEWSNNFVSNMDHLMKKLELTGNDVGDYFRYF